TLPGLTPAYCSVSANRRRRFLNLAQLLMPVAEHSLGGFPTDTGVGDRDAAAQVRRPFGYRLIAFLQITFDHQADQRRVSPRALSDHAVPDFLLARVLFAGVGVAAIHHQHLGQAGLLEDRGSRDDAVGVVIRPQPAAAQDNVAVPISGCADDARDPLLVDAQKTV